MTNDHAFIQSRRQGDELCAKWWWTDDNEVKFCNLPRSAHPTRSVAEALVEWVEARTGQRTNSHQYAEYLRDTERALLAACVRAVGEKS